MLGVIIDLKTYPTLNIAQCQGKNNLLFIILEEKDFQELESKAQGEERVSFFNSKPFLDKIIYKMCTEFDAEKKVISLGDCEPRHIKQFLDAVHRTFEENVTIVAGGKDVNPKLFEMGFSNPNICDKGNKICLNRKNTFINKPKPNLVRLDLEYLMKHKGKPHCNIKLEIDKESRLFLKHLTGAGVTQEDTGRSQKEIFGVFKISDGKKGRNKNIVYTLSVDRNSLVAGKEEEIEAFASLYNFHTHPKEAYLRHKVKNGIPSIADYCAVYQLSLQGTIIHFVATLEGIYAISVNPDHNILKKGKNEVLKYIEDKMPTERDNLEKYLSKANAVGLFDVRLIPYDQTTQIEATFNKQGDFGNCVIHDFQ